MSYLEKSQGEGSLETVDLRNTSEFFKGYDESRLNE